MAHHEGSVLPSLYLAQQWRPIFAVTPGSDAHPASESHFSELSPHHGSLRCGAATQRTRTLTLFSSAQLHYVCGQAMARSERPWPHFSGRALSGEAGGGSEGQCSLVDAPGELWAKVRVGAADLLALGEALVAELADLGAA